MKNLALFCAFFLLFSGSLRAGGAGGASPEARVEEGFTLYRKGKYKEALGAFREAFDGGVRDGRLEYDMGNCWWRLGDKARALVCYERARAWMPRDPDVLANIRLCRKSLGLDGTSAVPFLASLWKAPAAFTLGELVALAASFSVLCFLLLGAWTVFRKPYMGWLSLGFGAALLLFGGLALGRCLDRREYALVTAGEARLLSEPRGGLSPIAVLRAGLEVEVLGGEGAWIRVEAGGRKGWLPAKDLGFLDWRKPPFP